MLININNYCSLISKQKYTFMFHFMGKTITCVYLYNISKRQVFFSKKNYGCWCTVRHSRAPRKLCRKPDRLRWCCCWCLKAQTPAAKVRFHFRTVSPSPDPPSAPHFTPWSGSRRIWGVMFWALYERLPLSPAFFQTEFACFGSPLSTKEKFDRFGSAFPGDWSSRFFRHLSIFQWRFDSQSLGNC